MDDLEGYLEAVKRNMETMTASDYDGKEEDLSKQQEEIENYERQIKEKSISAEGFDQIVDAAVDCAAGDITFSQLEHVYQQASKQRP
ncbi:YnfE family protein [Bacillus swezeyi]|uniref:YnfE family protein n=1 Tax=Bacillus swezeyi TaxID=1925020 RepID=UPI0027DB8404|nr:YnfE family protein [Bacillus swezeyi]